MLESDFRIRILSPFRRRYFYPILFVGNFFNSSLTLRYAYSFKTLVRTTTLLYLFVKNIFIFQLFMFLYDRYQSSLLKISCLTGWRKNKDLFIYLFYLFYLRTHVTQTFYGLKDTKDTKILKKNLW